jgi:hypothetical protein
MRLTKNKQKNHDALRIVRGALPSAACNSASDDGEEFICSNCDVPEKPCIENPQYECAEKILGGTQLESARARFRSLMNGESPCCESCGKRLSAVQLQREPLSELCPACRGALKSPRLDSEVEK